MSNNCKRSSLDIKITAEMSFPHVKQKNNKTSTPSRGFSTPKSTPNRNLVKTPCSLRSGMKENRDNAEETSTPRSSTDNESESGRICVGVRVRPPCSSTQPIALSGGPRHIEANVSSGTSVTYNYDRVFWSSDAKDTGFSTQRNIFDEMAAPLLEKAVKGYNTCLFAYGQTGSGKTYSMMGPDNCFQTNEAGIIPRTCHELFKTVTESSHEYVISVSYYEIYNEKIYDLLGESKDSVTKVALKVREHPLSGPYVENLSMHRANSYEDIKVLVTLGNTRRVTAATLYNHRSSRSHSILEIMISTCIEGVSIRSKMSLVDLAGSERVAVAHISGDRYREGLSINKSLLTLGKVITCLSDMKKNTFVPYRESVLTWLLKENLGDNSFTVMLATISPDTSALEETLATLRYACQARRIINRVSINEDPQFKVIRQLRQEIERLKSTKNNVHEKLMKVDKTYSPVVRDLKTEMQRKAVEDQLQSEMKRLTSDLQAAEQRRVELESQRNMFIEKGKFGDVSFYKTDFFEMLQNILNDSSEADNVSVDSEDSLIHLREMEKTMSALQHSCAVNLDDQTYKSRVLPLLMNMKKAYDDIHNVLTDLMIES